MGYAGPKAISKVNMIIKDKSCKLPGIKGLGNPLKKTKVKGGQTALDANKDGYLTGSDFKSLGNSPATKKHNGSGIYTKGCKKRKY